MTFSTKQIEFLARAIVNRLEDRGLVEFTDAETGIEVVIKTLSDNFRTADTIMGEARENLVRSNGGREPSDEEMSDEVRRIAAARSFIL